MSYWFLPTILSDDQRKEALQARELQLPAAGLADLSRAQGPDQIAGWLRQIQPDATPEQINDLTDHFWRLGHELLNDDIILIRTENGYYMIGEVTGAYRREARAQGMSHVWPVEWLRSDLPASGAPKFALYAGATRMTEITDELALQTLKTAAPALRKGNTGYFRWLGLIILIFELIYFWPKD